MDPLTRITTIPLREEIAVNLNDATTNLEQINYAAMPDRNLALLTNAVIALTRATVNLADLVERG